MKVEVSREGKNVPNPIGKIWQVRLKEEEDSLNSGGATSVILDVAGLLPASLIIWKSKAILTIGLAGMVPASRVESENVNLRAASIILPRNRPVSKRCLVC